MKHISTIDWFMIPRSQYTPVIDKELKLVKSKWYSWHERLFAKYKRVEDTRWKFFKNGHYAIGTYNLKIAKQEFTFRIK